MFRVMLGPDGVVLMPSVFNWPQVSVHQGDEQPDDAAVPGARYRHGVGGRSLVPPASGALEELLGAARARLLGALRSPATTTALARRCGVTPSAVSQHLAVLHRGGLVDRRAQRAQRAVPGL